MSRPLWTVRLLERVFPARFLLARTTRIPLWGRLVDRFFFDRDDLLFLPQDRLIPIHEPIGLPDEIILPSSVVEHFIEQASVHWRMDSCICRRAERCQDYPIDLGCLFLGDAALGINPQLGHRVSREEALEHVRRCREAGLVHMIGRNKLDTIWLGVGPGERLLTICNCCPCCCLWRALPHLAPGISRKITRMPGVAVSVNDACSGCGACADGVCFVDAITVVDGRAAIGEQCRGCGRCAEVCPTGAIEVTLDRHDFLDECIQRITPLVDVS
jgi:hypothetical protein